MPHFVTASNHEAGASGILRADMRNASGKGVSGAAGASGADREHSSGASDTERGDSLGVEGSQKCDVALGDGFYVGVCGDGARN